MAVSEARKRANHKYDAKTYWRPALRIRKEHEAIIRQYAGDSVNDFITQAIMEKIERLKATE